jgi:hypothetical protein
MQLTRRSSDIAGIVEIRVSGAPSCINAGFGAELIELTVPGNVSIPTGQTRRAVYIAAEVLRRIGGAADVFQPSIKYGAGGRRAYVRLTEKVIEAIGAEAQDRGRKSERNPGIRDFAVALIDLL